MVSKNNNEVETRMNNIRCPLWNKSQKHPNHCCKLVGCTGCNNVWCTIGNPQVKGYYTFEGYFAIICKGIVVTYLNIKTGKHVHDPRTEGAIPIDIIPKELFQMELKL